MNNNYVVLARKYRPTTINELKGQDVLVTTLNNAFNSNRIAHAFLLSGVRGIGKTTTARILAKALNCIGIDGKGAPTLNPCNQCENCISINLDKNLDVLEIDAASKTGIDDIREIIETIKYKPIKSRYKVYIIDEIHMLSKSAFNALLKTLEEPPAFVKFIFATTELKKVPITVISRCQRFDLRRLTSIELKEHLSSICKNENIQFEEDALLLISNAAEGSVRDSLSLLDQAINISNGNITKTVVIDLLGKGNKEDIFKLFNAFIENDSDLALQIFGILYKNGIEITIIFEELLEVCHLVTMTKTACISKTILNSGNEIEIFKTNPNLQNLSLLDIEKSYAAKIALNVNLNNLIVLWQILMRGLEEIKISTFPKKTAEMLIIRITWISQVASLKNLSSVLDKLSSEPNINTIHKQLNNTQTDNNEVSESISESSKINSTTLLDNNKNIKNLEKEKINIDKTINANASKDKQNKLTLEEIYEFFPDSKIINKNS